MPAAWDEHERTILSWPANADHWGERLPNAAVAFAELARLLRRFEPVLVYTPDEMEREASLQLGREISVRGEEELPDCWLGDTGATFLINGRGGRAAVVWRFNGWGNREHLGEGVGRFAAELAELYAHPCFDGRTVLEGGALEFDAVGTLLTTESVLMNSDRNPNLDKQQLEERLALTLGARRIIWLESGLLGDHADGHVVNVARFTGPAQLLCAVPSVAGDPNGAALARNKEILNQHTDALAREMQIRDIPLPPPLYDGEGRPIARSYLSFYLCNGGLIAPVYEEATDAEALSILKEVFPAREIVPYDANELARGGGSIAKACLALPRREVL